MKQLILIFLFLSTRILSQSKTDNNTGLFNDTIWTKENTFKCNAQFVSVKKERLVPCGNINDWTTGKFKITKVDNKKIKNGQIYTFYIPCGAGLNNVSLKKGTTYIINGIIKFPENDSTLNYLNKFRMKDANRLYLGKITQQ